MATRLFVGNLPDNTAESDLRSAFSSYGEITNLDLKSKSAAGNEKKFAFVTISGSNYDIETCIKHFSIEDFNGNRLYVTRARESFLERLQRERLEAQQKETEKGAHSPMTRRKVRKAPFPKSRRDRSDQKKDVSGASRDGACASHFKHNANTNVKKVSLLINCPKQCPEHQFVSIDLQVEEQKNAKNTPILKLGDKLNPRKRKIEEPTQHKVLVNSKSFENNVQYGDGPDILGKRTEIYKAHNLELGNKPHKKRIESDRPNYHNRKNDVFGTTNDFQNGDVMGEKKSGNASEMYKKKQDSDYKRMEAMKRKSQEFKQKKNIVKCGLTDVDKVANKKIIFSDNEDDTHTKNGHVKIATKNTLKKTKLFDNDDDEDSGDDLNFEIKKQYEGKKGQKVLDLQSRYKSDKRFVLDERFIEDEADAGEDHETTEGDSQVELNQEDEKAKQLNILQDVLGIRIRKKVSDEERDGKRNKPKVGMLRFDPSQPGHAKFLAPIEDTKQESTKKTKKKKDKQTEFEVQEQSKPEEPRPEVSKEQFYKISDTLKEAIAQPTSFSLRSLFGNTEPAEKESKEETDYIPLEPPKKSKIKNPLQPGDRNPFVYDSSDSETEEVEKETRTESTPVVTDTKAVWKENFFFGPNDQRFEEGLAFFTRSNEPGPLKDRRELKSLVKKRIYNKERKEHMQMFRKKIGGRKKTMKKSFRRKN